MLTYSPNYHQSIFLHLNNFVKLTYEGYPCKLWTFEITRDSVSGILQKPHQNEDNGPNVIVGKQTELSIFINNKTHMLYETQDLASVVLAIHFINTI